MKQPTKTNDEIKATINRCRFKDRMFSLLTPSSGELFLQMTYTEEDTYTGEIELQSCRKWRLSRYMTTSEIVQTCFKAVITSQEHVAREFFRYREVNIFGPHYDVEKLVALRRATDPLDTRSPLVSHSTIVN